ncbi:MAG: hypothetical protein LBS95_00535, partial [Mycoplasmataceae bacterium]|nr:hypothetical protein [Mycoplasmataceae bacterium]
MSKYNIKIEKRINKDNLVVEATRHNQGGSGGNGGNKNPSTRDLVSQLAKEVSQLAKEMHDGFNKINKRL